MRIHKARIFITDPLFFIAQKKKSHVKSQQKITRVDSALVSSWYHFPCDRGISLSFGGGGGGAHIHIFAFKNCKNNRFQKKLMQNTNI